MASAVNMDHMDTEAKVSSRWRWLLGITLVLLALMVVGGFGVGYLLDNEKVRGLLSEQLGILVGKPASVESVDLTWFPVPGLTAYGVRAGDATFEARAASATAYIQWLPLLTGRVAIDTIQLNELGLTLPEDPSQILELWNHVSDQLGGGEDGGGGGGIQVTLAGIEAEDLHATRGGRVAAEGSFAVSGLDEDQFEIAAALRAPLIAPQAVLDATLIFDSTLATTGIGGEVSLQGFSVDTPVAARADLEAELSGDVNNITVAIAGTLALPGEDDLEGPVSATAWWRDEKIIVNNFQWQAPGVETIADLTWVPGEAIALKVNRLALPASGIAAALAHNAPSGVRVAPAKSARFTAKDVLLGIELDGDLTPYTGEATFFDIDFLDTDGTTLIDNIGGRIHLADNTLFVDELTAEGLSITASIRPDSAAGTYAITASGQADLATADPSPWLPLEGLRLNSGTVQINELSGTFGADEGMPTDLAVSLALNGVAGQLAPSAGADPVPFSGLSGGIKNEGSGWAIDDLRAEGIRLSGSFQPESDSEGWAMNLSGGAELSSPLVALVMPAGVLENPGGSVAFTRLSGIFTPGEGAPRNLAIEGQIKDGTAKLNTDALQDTLSGVNASFSTSENTITVDATLRSEQFGSLAWDGSYATADDVLEGSLRGDLGRVAAMYLPAEARTWADGALGSYGNGPYALRLELREERTALSLSLRRSAAPVLDANLSMRSGASGWTLSELRGTGAVALEHVNAALPAGIRGSGTAEVAIDMDPTADAIAVNATLDNTSIQFGEYLTKRTGQAAAIQVQLKAGAMESIGVDVLGESFTLRAAGAGLAAEDFALDLAKMQGLLPDDARASGSVSGSFQTSPPAADLQLAGAAFSLSDGLGVDALDGGIRYRSGLVEVDNMRIRGANSDCTLSAETQGESWRGELRGAKLDLNAVQAMYRTFSSMAGGGEDKGASAGSTAQTSTETTTETTTEAGTTKGYAGTLVVELGEVYYNSGVMQNLRTQVSVLPQSTTFSDLSLVPGSGTVSGEMVIRTATGATPTMLDLRLELAAADLATLDQLIFETPREIAGAMDGTVDLRFPLDDAPLNGLNGRFDYTATEGTYGKFGIATKLLGLLRTTELIRLRLPSLRDQGLNFDTSEAAFRFEDGVMHWDKMEVTSKSHSFAASGLIDFPKNETNIVVRMHLLEAVTGSIIGQLPVIKQTVNVIKKATPMRVRITGPPLTPDAEEDAAAEEDPEAATSEGLPLPDTAEEVFEVDSVDTPEESAAPLALPDTAEEVFDLEPADADAN